MKLNEKGQCPECLRKPIPYKGQRSEREKFCCRCNRSFDYDTGEFRTNWAWVAPYERKSWTITPT